MVYGSWRNRKNVLSCIILKHWKCGESVTFLLRVGLQLFTCLVCIHSEFCLPNHTFKERTKHSLGLGNWFVIIWKDLYTAMVLLSTYQPYGAHSNFFLSIESLDFCLFVSLFHCFVVIVLFVYLFPREFLLWTLFTCCFQYILSINLVCQFTLNDVDSAAFLVVR